MKTSVYTLPSKLLSVFRMRNRGRSVQTGPGSGGNDIDSLMDERIDTRSQGIKAKKKKGKVREKDGKKETKTRG